MKTDYARLTDQQLIDVILEGDTSAFSEIYRRYHRRIFRVCNSILMDPELSKDITQEVFIKIYDKLSTFRGNSALFTWMYPFARNLTYDHLRKQRPVEAIEPHHEAVMADDDLMEKLEDFHPSRLKIALQQMDISDREILIMKYAYDWSVEELSAFMDISEGALKMRLLRARSKLKDIYEGMPE